MESKTREVQLRVPEAPASPGALLAGPTGGIIDPGAKLGGFGGLHGGLLLALMVSAMSEQAPGVRLHSATSRFYRPVSGEFSIKADVTRRGRVVSVLCAEVASDRGVHAQATAVYGSSQSGDWPAVIPEPPSAPPPLECETFSIPPEFAPISEFMEIRPVGPNRPYSGGPDPELTAWIRLLEDDQPPDVLRFVLLMDGLAPSYSAVLANLVLIPTVELTVRPGDALIKAASPWVLLRARTRVAGLEGWSEEVIDAWGPDGSHLGSAQQLRVVRAD